MTREFACSYIFWVTRTSWTKSRLARSSFDSSDCPYYEKRSQIDWASKTIDVFLPKTAVRILAFSTAREGSVATWLSILFK